MQDTRSKLIEAAISLFSRYGYKRTSMADIAQEAEVSRQTLYSQFANKEEMLHAAMEAVAQQIFTQLEDEFQSCDSADELLNTYFETAVYPTFTMLKKSPELVDLIHGVGEETAKLAKKFDTRKIKLLADELAPYEDRLQTLSSSPLALAQYIVTSTNEIKYNIKSRRELEGLLETLKIAVRAMLEG